MAAQDLRVKTLFPAFELQNGGFHCLYVLFREKEAGNAVPHCFRGPAPAVGQHRNTRSRRFQRNDPEILFAREKQGPTVRQQIRHGGVALTAKKADAGRGFGLEGFKRLPFSDPTSGRFRREQALTARSTRL